MVQVNLCELLLEELKYSGGEEIVEDIQKLLNRISNVANKQRSIITLVILYSLQAKLALIEGDAELSNNLLNKALTIANNKGLELISNKLTAQQNELFNQLEDWKALLVRNSSIQERFELLNLNKFIEMVKNKLEKKFESKKERREL